jgi:hypothetical protein
MLIGVVVASLLVHGKVTDLLPDEIVWDRYMTNAYVSTTTTAELPAGRRCLRFDTTTANIGTGTLELLGQAGSSTTGTQPVNQRIYRSDNTFYDRLAGNFSYHPTHNHMHFDDWTIFRLRAYLPGGEVGSVIRTGTKSSFCIIETTVYDSTMPGFSNSAWGPYGCGTKQGHRPGHADTYGSSLAGQYIDIVGVPDGIYWLEGEVNPNRNVLESSYANNISRVPINIGGVPTSTPDAFEDNDTRAIVDAAPEGATNSPNLGIVNAYRVMPTLSIDDSDDWYKFKLNNTGGPGDYARIETPYNASANKLNFYLYNSAGTQLVAMTDQYSVKQITLNGRVAGTYYLRVQRSSSNNPLYRLIIDPAGNLPPSITLTSPPAGLMYVEKAFELVPVTWTCSDPEGDPKTMSLLVDSVPVARPENMMVTGFESLQGSDLQANLNTTSIPVGKWYVIGRAWDGGAYGYSVSQGAFLLYTKGDLTMDGVVNLEDADMFLTSDPTKRWAPSWYRILDMDRDGRVTRTDIDAFLEEADHGG